MEQEKQNSTQMRIFTAFAIIFVVIAHVTGGASGSFGLAFFDWFSPTQFVVSMFIAVSGYFYNNKAIYNIKKYILKKTKRLLLPMYVWNIIYGIIVVSLLPEFDGAEISFNTLVIMPLWSGHQFHLNLATWFIAPIFFTQVINILIHKFFYTIRLKNELLIIELYLIIGICGFELAERGYNHGMLLLLLKIMIFMGYFAIGIGYKYYLEKHDRITNWLYFIIVLLFQLSLLYFVQGKNDIMLGTNMAWLRDVHSTIIPYISATVGMSFWLRISKILAPLCTDANNLLITIGNRSYDIMCHHLAGAMLVKLVFAFGYKYFHIFKEFDTYRFLHQTYYFYFPNNLPQFCLLYILAGIAFPLFVSKYTSVFLDFLAKTIRRRNDLAFFANRMDNK